MPIKKIEQSLYEIKNKELPKKCYFGITYLDAAFKGINSTDLVLLSGLTGTGKTELGSIIADTNIKNGKVVMYIALEADDNEIAHRIRFRLASKKYYAKTAQQPKETLLYDDYLDGELDLLLRDELKETDNIISDEYSGLDCFYRDLTDKHFGINELKKLIEDTHHETDLYIIDHLHFFNLDGDNENKAMKDLLYAMRDTVLIYKRPIVLISHIRKRGKLDNSIVPTLDDLHGSSDIVKTGTKIAFIAPYFGEDIPQDGYKYPTIFYCGKNRRLGSIAHYAGIQYYDARDNNYSNDLFVGKINNTCTKFTPIKTMADLPPWARKRVDYEFLRFDFCEKEQQRTAGVYSSRKDKTNSPGKD